MISITVVYGKEQVSKVINNINLDENELKFNKKTYNFDSEKEVNAFIKGLNEAVGWQELYVLEDVIG